MNTAQLTRQPVRQLLFVLVAALLFAGSFVAMPLLSSPVAAQEGGNVHGGQMTVKHGDNASIINITLKNGTKITVITGKDGSSHTTVDTADGDNTSVATDDDGDSRTNTEQGDNNNNGQ